MYSRSLSCTCFCGWFSASRTRISSTYAPRTPQKFGHNWQKIFSQIKYKKIPRVHIFLLMFYLERLWLYSSTSFLSSFDFYMSAYADQNHAPSLAAARLEFSLLNLWTKKDKHYSAYLFSHSRMPRHSLLTINGSCGFHIHARHRYVPLHDHDHDDCTLHQDYNLTFRS